MVDVDALIARIIAGETPGDCEARDVDFKEDRGSPADLESKLVKACVCFANAAGGTVIVGVADKTGGPAALTGTTLSPEQVRQRLHELTKPPLLVDIELRDTPARLLILRVRGSATVHSDAQGRSWQRINRDCIPLQPTDQARLVRERSGYDWSAEASGRDVTDVQPGVLAAARTLLLNQPDERRELARHSDQDLLSALGLLSDRTTLNRAGELMCCTPREAGASFCVYQYKVTPGGEPRTVQRVALPLLTAFERLLELVTARQSTTPIAMPNGQQITIADVPTIAVREVLSNAICHRDWETPAVIAIEHAPEVFSVTSPGPLVTGVTPDNILTVPSRPRNAKLAGAVRRLGWAEETGRGVDRMVREAIRSGQTPPSFDATMDRVKVTFVGGAPDTNIARFVARLPEQEREDTDTMLLLHHLCRFQTITLDQASSLVQKPLQEVETVLRRLIGEPPGLLELTRHSAQRRRRVSYRLRADTIRGLGAAVTYNRRTMDDTDRKIVEHVREYGRITNRTLQNLFDVHVFKARDIIASLKERGILVLVSDAARGSKVEWGPGPKFPKVRRAPKQPGLAP